MSYSIIRFFLIPKINMLNVRHHLTIVRCLVMTQNCFKGFFSKLVVDGTLSQFLAATKQLYERYFLSVCPSVCHTFLTMFPSSYHHELFRSYYQWQKWYPCKRSRSEIKGQGHRGHNPTLPFPDCNSSLNSHMMMKSCIWLDDTYERCPIVFQGHPSNFKVTRL